MRLKYSSINQYASYMFRVTGYIDLFRNEYDNTLQKRSEFNFISPNGFYFMF